MGERPFFGRIESLRGLGCLAVAAYHASGWWLNGSQLLPHEPWNGVGASQNTAGRIALALIPGHAALMMFFAISGCVLYVSLQYGPQDVRAASRRFFVARIFRIFPIVIFGVLGCLLAEHWSAPTAPDRPLTTVLANMLLLDSSINGVYWALQVEVLMAPIILLLYFVDRSYGTRPLIFIAVAATALSFSKHWAVWPPLSNNLYAFVIGMLVPTTGRKWVAALTERAANRWLFGAVVTLFAAGPLMGFYSRFTAVFETYGAFVLLSVAAYRINARGLSFLDGWAVRQLGITSGSYYVLHMPLLLVVVPAAALVIPAAWSQQVPLLAGILALILILAAMVPICVLSYRFVEAPGIALGRLLLRPRRVDTMTSAGPAVIM